jgi:hypothetical protein
LKDTSPSVEGRYRALILARPPAERFLMAIGMFDTARSLVIASLPSNSTMPEIRQRLVERFYSDVAPDKLPPELRR